MRIGLIQGRWTCTALPVLVFAGQGVVGEFATVDEALTFLRQRGVGEIHVHDGSDWGRFETGTDQRSRPPCQVEASIHFG